MKANDLRKLETDNKFKKKHLPKLFWLTQAGIYPPASVIFIALIGLVYLLNSDMLISYYAIPFAVLLLLGAIWLKATKKYVLKALFAKEDSFLVCISSEVDKDDKFSYLVFSTSDKRHNQYQVDNIVASLKDETLISGSDLSKMKAESKGKAVLLPENISSNQQFYLKAFKTSSIPYAASGSVVAVLFLNTKHIELLKN